MWEDERHFCNTPCPAGSDKMFRHEPVSTLLIEDRANSAWCIPALLSDAKMSWVRLTRAADLHQGLAAATETTSFPISCC